MIRPTLFPIHQQKRLVNSTSNIHQLTHPDITNNLKRSKSTSKKQQHQQQQQQPDLMTKNTSRIDTIRRALTTSRTKKDGSSSSTTPSRSNSIFSSRRDQKSYSLHNPSTPPLYISLPDVEQLHTTPPLSPPSSSANQQIWTIPNYLPDLTQQQDCIIRHIAVLYIESHVVNDCILLDDLLLENNNKKSSSSLWGKLKTHILTPNENNMATLQQLGNNNDKKIGVSLSNISNGSLSSQQQQKTVEIQNFEYWKTQCPSVGSCFSSSSYAPGFIKDCILAMIDQDVNTEGIFRKNGNIRVLKEMCEQLDDVHQQRDDWLNFFRDQHIIQLAAFLKRYLRELPEPLLTTRLHKLFLTSNDNPDKIALIHYGICLLPKVNRDILLLVLSLLNWVAKHSGENKMDFENLARVMAPNILYSHKKQSSSSCVDVSLCHGEIRVVATMIEYYDTFIKVPNDFTVLLENPKMAEYLYNNSIDLTCSKHFLKTYSSLLKLKKDIASSEPVLPPSPSTSTL
ncbi:Rho GTPase activation protein [Helicostylum pulchrum]|nr:Rho GTPase activation protein [Helicostylum pulchrum]